jgi:aspartyl-tRNA(Asn)/glutamyl-tRNA(Gln) amidotransferase subunit C
MDRSELDVTAELALMDLTEDERARLEPAVAQLLEYFSVMDGIDVSALEPTTHALQEGNRLRADSADAGTSASGIADPNATASASALADDILEQAPELEDRFIAIPNVL